MRIDILTLFPKMFDSVLNESMLRRAQDKGALKFRIHNLRDWTFDAHRSADDKPFGGGAGMVMKVDPVYRALKSLGLLKKTVDRRPKTKDHMRIILLTPQGKKLNQIVVKKLSKERRLILICGHYEGVDERIRSLVDEEVSIGDYILTCGEIPALVLIDAVARLKPGVLGSQESLRFETFENRLLEYPQYTRPEVFMGMKAPRILLSGDHKKIAEWRLKESLKRTRERRPDLIIKKGTKHGKTY
ncbi:MAG: tRNA (guanosine(37)-N1)-methyltransferase TrmD [Omnitrophica bacterium RIFCSPLOWO2_01_FULL_45_10]|nr:MAG: tRNA (guanosine(37)-N1)-methyltransferase TrmD [Omnitrophica bacterium RIFCSPLOWO2_01_FULL_45_10]